MQTEERQLIERSLKKDARAYGELVERYKKAIYYHCFSVVHDEATAEDIAQETFIAAYYKLNTFDISRKFSTWLFKIATNKALDHLKSIKRVQPLSDDDAAKLVSSFITPDTSAEHEELHRVVANLEPKYRTVVSLYYWQGLSYAEIAEIMGKPEGSVKVWMLRAKEEIRKELR